MTANSTFLDAMRDAAVAAGDARGFRFYANPTDSVFASYAQLDRRARADAAALAAMGHAPGEVAVLAFEPGLDFIRALYATFYAGLVAAPVPVAATRQPDVAVRRLEAIVLDSGSRLVLTDGTALPSLGLEPGGTLAGADLVPIASIEGAVDDWSAPAITADSLAILQYTSGSTGLPKGVMVSHGNLVANEAAIAGAVGITAASRTMGWLPHYHDMGLIGQLLQPVSVAADSVLTSPSQFLRRPLLWLRLITQHRSTHTVGPDFAYALCTRLVTDDQLGDLDLSSLEGVITGAEPVRADTLAAFAGRFGPAGFRARAFIPAYGMAETTLLVTASVREGAVSTVDADAEGIERGELRAARRSGGAPWSWCRADRPPTATRSSSSTRGPASGRQPGRSARSSCGGRASRRGTGSGRMPRRRRSPPRSRAIPTAADTCGPATSGVLVDGELVITGRLKDLIIIRGRNLYPQDLEGTAAGLLHSGCLSAAFEGTVSQPLVGLVAEVDTARVSPDDLGDLAERVRRSVAEEFQLPELGVALIRKGTLPRTTSGKVQRSLTRSLLADDRLATVLTLGFERAGAR